MKKNSFSRRKFIKIGSLVALSAGILHSVSGNAMSLRSQKEPKTGSLCHHVFYWLEHPDSEQERDQLVAGLHKLCTAPQIRYYHIGISGPYFKKDDPLANWQVSLLMVFDKKEDINAYHKTSTHQEFVAANKHLWVKTIKFDAIGA